ERHMDVAVEGSQNSRLLLRWHEEQQEAATTGAGQLAAERTGRPGLFVQSINLRIGNNAAETALGLPSFAKQFAETRGVRCACQEVEAFIDQIFHDAQLSAARLDANDIAAGNVGCGSRDAGVNQHQMRLQFGDSSRRQDYRADLDLSIRRKLDVP